MSDERTAREIALELVRDSLGDAAEIALDQVLDGEVVRELPLVGWAVRGWMGTRNISDAVRVKRFIRFAMNVDRATEEQLEAFKKFLEKGSVREHLDELLVALLESVESEKLPLIGRVFSVLAKGEMQFREFARYAETIKGCNIADLRILYLLNPKAQGQPLVVEVARRLESFGLVEAQRPAGPHTQNAQTGQVDLSEVPVTVTPHGARLAQVVIRKGDVTPDGDKK